MNKLTPVDYEALRGAMAKLETESYAMKVAAKVGMPVEALLQRLPLPVQSAIKSTVDKALERCLRVAVRGEQTSTLAVPHKRAHTAAAAFAGAVGGFFGLPGLLVELPITTTVMLHSIVEIARMEGEDLSNPESALACLEVFALGPQSKSGDLQESAYYATRTALAQVTREAVSYVTRKGVAKETGPALLSFAGKIASRFGIEVSEKVAAELVPIAGALGGLTLNVLFSHHFQSLAEGHFVVRRLERKYGSEAIRQEYEAARALPLPS